MAAGRRGTAHPQASAGLPHPGESNNSPAGIAKNENLAEWWLALRPCDGGPPRPSAASGVRPGAGSGRHLAPPYLLLDALHARLERPKTVKTLGKSSGPVHHTNVAIPCIHAAPSLSVVALGPR